MMNSQFDDVLSRLCYKNQCNTNITAGDPYVTRWPSLSHRADVRVRG